MRSPICPITYEPVVAGERYSQKGLRLLSPQLKNLKPLPLNAEELRVEARKRAHKISIQGVQIKLSAKLRPSAGLFEITDVGGRFILKPPHELYPELPENEDLTMRLAKKVGIETPLHGLVYSREGSRTYFIRRFDRTTHKQKLPLEDFAQLSGNTRNTKYDFSMERLVPILDRHATFPLLERRKLFARTIFNYLVGNEDMHLKNFSLISREEKVELAPAYDFLNTTLVLGADAEEIALPLCGKKRNLNRKILIDYFALEKLALNKRDVEEILNVFVKAKEEWKRLVGISFLSAAMKTSYLQIMENRRQRLQI
ncbi:MAG: HipA domain-containing protein [Deltaproteobacteria bacterium]|nr:HipA domain-containing protein [Deltaproteobacteria bacterium]